MLPSPKKAKPKKAKMSPKAKKKQEDRKEATSPAATGTHKLVLRIPKHCPDCGQKFESKQQMDKHVKEACSKRPSLGCEKCKKTFKTEAQVKLSRKILIPNRQFFCGSL